MGIRGDTANSANTQTDCACDGTCLRADHLSGRCQTSTTSRGVASEAKEPRQDWKDDQIVTLPGGKRLCVPCARRVVARSELESARSELEAVALLRAFAPAWLTGFSSGVIVYEDDRSKITLTPNRENWRAPWHYTETAGGEDADADDGDLVSGDGARTTASAVLREIAGRALKGRMPHAPEILEACATALDGRINPPPVLAT